MPLSLFNVAKTIALNTCDINYDKVVGVVTFKF